MQKYNDWLDDFEKQEKSINIGVGAQQIVKIFHATGDGAQNHEKNFHLTSAIFQKTPEYQNATDLVIDMER